MALLEPVLLLLLEDFLSFGLHSLLHPRACCVMGSEEVTARGAAAPISVQEGPVAPWLCVTGSSVTQDGTSVPVFCVLGGLG